MLRSLATLVLILLAVFAGPCFIVIGVAEGQIFSLILGAVATAVPLLLARAINRSDDTPGPRYGPPPELRRPIVPPAPGETPADRN